MESDVDVGLFLDEYRAEAGEHVQALTSLLLRLEQCPSDLTLIRLMFLSAHTIKGCAAMVEKVNVSTVAHAMEDVLTWLRDEHQPLDKHMADVLFRALDLLRELVNRVVDEESDSELVESMATQLHACVGALPVLVQPAMTETEPPRVLLVEHSSTVRLLESMQLSDAGFVVDAVADGQEALGLALTKRYGLLVTAIETRGLRGLDLAAMLRTLPAGRGLPIVVMSSDDNSTHRERAAEVGVQAYIRKGAFGQHRLVETARELTGYSGRERV